MLIQILWPKIDDLGGPTVQISEYPLMFVQEYFGYIVSLIPDQCNKVNIAIK